MQCSFCGKSQDQVKKLIAGPGVNICNECVDLCQQILDHQREGEESSTPAGEPTALTPDIILDSLQPFLKDIGKVRLLTAQEEVDLAKRIERGDLDAKQQMVESQPPSGRLDCEELSQPGADVPGADPGRHERACPRRGEVRLPQWLPVLLLRQPVDPPSDRARAPGLVDDGQLLPLLRGLRGWAAPPFLGPAAAVARERQSRSSAAPYGGASGHCLAMVVVSRRRPSAGTGSR